MAQLSTLSTRLILPESTPVTPLNIIFKSWWESDFAMDAKSILSRRKLWTESGINGTTEPISLYLLSKLDTFALSSMIEGMMNHNATPTINKASAKVVNTAMVRPFKCNNVRLICTNGSKIYATSHATINGSNTLDRVFNNHNVAIISNAIITIRTTLSKV